MTATVTDMPQFCRRLSAAPPPQYIPAWKLRIEIKALAYVIKVKLLR